MLALRLAARLVPARFGDRLALEGFFAFGERFVVFFAAGLRAAFLVVAISVAPHVRAPNLACDFIPLGHPERGNRLVSTLLAAENF